MRLKMYDFFLNLFFHIYIIHRIFEWYIIKRRGRDEIIYPFAPQIHFIYNAVQWTIYLKSKQSAWPNSTLYKIVSDAYLLVRSIYAIVPFHCARCKHTRRLKLRLDACVAANNGIARFILLFIYLLYNNNNNNNSKYVLYICVIWYDEIDIVFW